MPIGPQTPVGLTELTAHSEGTHHAFMNSALHARAISPESTLAASGTTAGKGTD